MSLLADHCVEGISETSLAMFGDRLEETRPAVLHTTAVWRRPREYVTILIDETAPKSPYDRFVLHLSRARADAVVTSGKNLRAEPTLDHEVPEAFVRWRRERLKKTAPPVHVVLTSGQDLDPDHPIFSTAGEHLVYTSTRRERALGRALGERPIELLASAQPSLKDLLRRLRDRGLGTVLVETGPSTSRGLYEDPPLVDELVLSIYGGALAARSRGGSLPATITRRLVLWKPAFEVRSGGADWSFQRYLRITAKDGHCKGLT